ncbi:MAG TPA: eS25 family ribosomal protein [candidate division Zixibacteria bacterium]|nr:eS25 family ribosomal protein [candidate division Zixibacteria bacterium]
MALRQSVNKRKGKWGRVKEFESIERALIIDDDMKQKMLKEIPKQKVITPTAVCQKYQVRMYVANEIIKELVSTGVITFHQKTAYTNVYKAAKA